MPSSPRLGSRAFIFAALLLTMAVSFVARNSLAKDVTVLEARQRAISLAHEKRAERLRIEAEYGELFAAFVSSANRSAANRLAWETGIHAIAENHRALAESFTLETKREIPATQSMQAYLYAATEAEATFTTAQPASALMVLGALAGLASFTHSVSGCQLSLLHPFTSANDTRMQCQFTLFEIATRNPDHKPRTALANLATNSEQSQSRELEALLTDFRLLGDRRETASAAGRALVLAGQTDITTAAEEKEIAVSNNVSAVKREKTLWTTYTAVAKVSPSKKQRAFEATPAASGTESTGAQGE